MGHLLVLRCGDVGDACLDPGDFFCVAAARRSMERP